jgi:hypothetical protein
MTFADFIRYAGSGFRAVKFLTNLLRPEIESVWFLDPWPNEDLIDCSANTAHRLAYVCVRIANRSTRTFYPKEIGLEYREMVGFNFSRVPPTLDLEAEVPDEILPGEEKEVNFGTAAHALAVYLHAVNAGVSPWVRPIIKDRMGKFYPGRPNRFDVEKWRLGRKLSDEEFEYLTG